MYHYSGWLLHIAGAFLNTYLLLSQWPASSNYPKKWVAFFLLNISLLFPFLGPLCAIAITCIMHHPWSHPTEPLPPYVLGKDEPQEYLKKSEYIEHSLLEALTDSDSSFRRNTILAARLLPMRQVSHLFQRAMMDTDEHVRLFAQGHWQRTVRSSKQQIAEIQKLIDQNPEQPEYHAALAECYQEQVFQHIEPLENTQAVLAKAIEPLRHAIQLAPHNPTYLFSLQKLLIKTGKISEAEEILHQLEQMGYNPHLLLPWMLEVSFIQKKWNQFDRYVRQVEENAPFNILNPIISFWSSHG